MRQITFALFLLFECLGHAFAQHIDTAQYVILPYPSDTTKPQLSEKEIIKIELLLNKSVQEYNTTQQEVFKELHAKYPSVKREDLVIDLKEYKRQYFVRTNPEGEKVIWVNCLCETLGGSWREGIFLVDDGGKCFFNVKINLNKSKYYDFFVNGVG